MDATDRLCRMLEEHGVEYETDVLPNGKRGVSWIDGSDIEWEVVQRGENFEIHALQLVTPEQAIAATVDTGTCRNISDPPSGFLCSECGWGDFSEPTHLLKDAKHCPNCGKRIVEEKPYDND